MSVSSSQFHIILSFQNYHELQPEGDPGSSICSEPTPTLHVSKHPIFDSFPVPSKELVQCATLAILQHLFLHELVVQMMTQLIGTGFGVIMALPLLLRWPHILNETSIICR